MGYTLQNLRDLLRQHLGRGPEDESLSDAMLDGFINRHRRREWTRAGGPDADVRRLDVTAGRRDYPISVSGGVSAVTGVTLLGGATRSLPRMSPRNLLASGYPGDTDSLGCPAAYAVRPSSVNSPGWTMDPDGFGMPQTTGVIVSLYPAPDTDVAGGLLVEAAGQAGPLTDPDEISPLPEIADECACWAAADEMFAYRATEPGAALTLDHIQSHAEADRKELRRHLRSVTGGLTRIVPAFGFDGWGEAPCWEPSLRLPDDVSPYVEDTTIVTRRIIFNPTPGLRYATVTLDPPAIVSRGETAQAALDMGGSVLPVTFNADGTEATVTLREGAVYPDGETIYLWYDAAA